MGPLQRVVRRRYAIGEVKIFGSCLIEASVVPSVLHTHAVQSRQLCLSELWRPPWRYKALDFQRYLGNLHFLGKLTFAA